MAKKPKKETAADLVAQMEEVRAEMLPLQKEYKTLSALLLQALKEEGKKREGIFKISVRQTLKIVDTAKAMLWATDHNAITIDTSKARQIMRHELTLPEGFAIQESEYIHAGKEIED